MSLVQWLALGSIIGVMSVSTKGDEDPMAALNRGFYLTAVLVSVAIFGACKMLLGTPDAPDAWWHYFVCSMIGVATSVAFVETATKCFATSASSPSVVFSNA